MEPTTADWSSLPQDLLQLIAKKLTVIFDYTRFRSVCPCWRLAAGSVTLQPQQPYLVVSSPTNTILFLNLPHLPNHYALNLPQARGKLIYGSSNGWMLLIDRKPSSAPSPSRTVSLLNPITRVHVPLPQLLEVHLPAAVIKGVLCSIPGSTPPSQLLVAILTSTRVAFLKEGDTTWTMVNIFPSVFDDMVFLDTKLYVVDRNGRLGVFQHESSKFIWLLNMLPIQLTTRFGVIEAGGDLLLLRWVLNKELMKANLIVFMLGRGCNSKLKWVQLCMLDMIFFTSVRSICAQGLPDSGEYRIFVVYELPKQTSNTYIIQEIDVELVASMKTRPDLKVAERSWFQKQKNYWQSVTWIVPGQH